METGTLEQLLFEGTVDELLKRKDEFVGMHLQVFGMQEEDAVEDLPDPPFTIRDQAQLEASLLAGLTSPREQVPQQEWEDLRREVRERLAAGKTVDEA